MFSTKVDHLVLNQTPILFLFNVPKEFILRQQHILSIWSTKNKYEQYVHVKKISKKGNCDIIDEIYLDKEVY